MIKVYKKLTKDQLRRNVVFSSCLSVYRSEMENDNIHEVFKINEKEYNLLSNFNKSIFREDRKKEVQRLKDDKFFNESRFNFNIIREVVTK